MPGNAGTAEESAAVGTDEEYLYPHSDPYKHANILFKNTNISTSRFCAIFCALLTSPCLPPDIWAAVGLAVVREEAGHIHILGVTCLCSAGPAPVYVCGDTRPYEKQILVSIQNPTE